MRDPTMLPEVVRDHPAIGRALETLTDAQTDLERSKAALATARDELAAAIQETAASYRAGTAPLPLQLLRTLYWELPAVRVRDLARSVGMSTPALIERLGPRREPGSCYRCGREVVLARRSRSDRPHAVCDRCRLLDAIESSARLGPGWRYGMPLREAAGLPVGDTVLDVTDDAAPGRRIEREGPW